MGGVRSIKHDVSLRSLGIPRPGIPPHLPIWPTRRVFPACSAKSDSRWTPPGTPIDSRPDCQRVINGDFRISPATRAQQESLGIGLGQS
ncbi:hypothetical protein M404DRAFT_996988 [Pisolithus tinctorius Marx 270]|uniref:Uncharacterized protein n=1 Tax=Pisolithus tinctorius Marx 270 TaxID=870435 RepID=A0A0C3KGQ1_PISTI|nr:hypothetical protein M404DRAFT_996988 [Pisolithus tinctorius Marx 270]